MCRLSIIVPYDRDEAAFEASLVSVLENRPEHCEVIVAHDGGYCDPFDLGDEVRFVVGESTDPVSLIREAAFVSMGRVVHVLYDGARATEGWTEEPLSLFEQSDLGCVAPVVRDLSASGRIVAAGWRDKRGGLRQPLSAGSLQPSRRDAAAVQGAHLAASFWRRSTLEGLADLPLPTVTGVADYLWSWAMRSAGWRCRVATSSSVLASPGLASPSEGAFRAAGAMQAIRCAVTGQGTGSLCASSLLGLLGRPHSGAAWSQCLGRMFTPLRSNGQAQETLAAMRHFGEVAGPNAAEARILSMPTTRYSSMRRAA